MIDQETVVSLLPNTVALNCCVAEGGKRTLSGLTDTVSACGSWIVAVALCDGWPMLVAVSVTLRVSGAVSGATYTAVVAVLTRLPRAGLRDQVTPELSPVTVAEKVWVWDG